jgi:hypothetical protein
VELLDQLITVKSSRFRVLSEGLTKQLGWNLVDIYSRSIDELPQILGRGRRCKNIDRKESTGSTGIRFWF